MGDTRPGVREGGGGGSDEKKVIIKTVKKADRR